MLLVAEFEIDRAPSGFNRRFCRALGQLDLSDSESDVALVTAHKGGRAVRRIECGSAAIARRVKAIIAEIEPALMRGAR